MRILHILDHSLPLQSGYVYRTLGIVNEQRQRGWEPILLTSGKHDVPGPVREQIGAWEFLRTPIPAGFSSRLPVIREFKIVRDLDRRLDQVIASEAPDIIHAHSPVLNAIPALRAGRRHGLPVIYEVRALWEDAAQSFGVRGGGLRYRSTRCAETYALRRVDAVVTICEGLRNEFVARGIRADQITVVPNAVDPAAFAGARLPDRQLAAQLGLAGKTVLAFFGSFYFYEGLHILLRAVPELRRRRPEIAVVLAGGGPEEKNLLRLADELGLEDSVRFVGYLPQEELRRYYDLADLLVFPRIPMRLTELVTPLKPLEAMAQERIVVASNVGGHRELIRDRETGYLFPAGEPRALVEGVLAALGDRPSWQQIRQRALEFIRAERCWAHSVARYEEIYRRALQDRSAGQSASS